MRSEPFLFCIRYVPISKRPFFPHLWRFCFYIKRRNWIETVSRFILLVRFKSFATNTIGSTHSKGRALFVRFACHFSIRIFLSKKKKIIWSSAVFLVFGQTTKSGWKNPESSKALVGWGWHFIFSTSENSRIFGGLEFKLQR